MTKYKTIISLTSFPPRINKIHMVIESLLAQTVMPDKIILYLADAEFPKREIPKSLAMLANDYPVFEIRWVSKNLRSFKKLVPAIRDFPNDIIITVDDDIIYPENLVEILINRHKKYPNAICAGRVRRIALKDGHIYKYRKWKRYKRLRLLLYGANPKHRNAFVGVGGVLYPPKSIHPDVMRDDIFMKICPTTDDLWFWACAARHGTKVAPVWQILELQVVKGSQKESLMRKNCSGTNLNDVAMSNIIEKYPDILDKLAG